MKTKFAKINDVEELSSLSKKAHQEFRFWTYESKEKFREIISDKNKGVYYIKDIAYLVFNYNVFERRLWIDQIFVVKSYRKKGIARELIKNLIKRFKKIKHLNIVLLTADRNLNIFNHIGFKKTMNYMEYQK